MNRVHRESATITAHAGTEYHLVPCHIWYGISTQHDDTPRWYMTGVEMNTGVIDIAVADIEGWTDG